jgi:hypothetical protein
MIGAAETGPIAVRSDLLDRLIGASKRCWWNNPGRLGGLEVSDGAEPSWALRVLTRVRAGSRPAISSLRVSPTDAEFKGSRLGMAG